MSNAATEPPVAGAAGTVASAGPRDLSAYKEEQIAGGDLAAAAYLLLWAIIGAYLWRTARRQAAAEAALQALEQRLDAELARAAGRTGQGDLAGQGDGAGWERAP